MYLLRNNEPPYRFLGFQTSDNDRNAADDSHLSGHYSTMLTCLSVAILFVLTIWQCAKCKKNSEPERVVEETPAVVQENAEIPVGGGGKAPVFRHRKHSHQSSIESKIHAQGVQGSMSSSQQTTSKRRSKQQKKKKEKPSPAAPPPPPEGSQENIEAKKIVILSPQNPVGHSVEEEGAFHPPAPPPASQTAPVARAAPTPARPASVDDVMAASLKSDRSKNKDARSPSPTDGEPSPPNKEAPPAHDVSQPPSLPSPTDFAVGGSLKSDRPKIKGAPLVTAEFYSPTTKKNIGQKERKKVTAYYQLR